MSDYGMITVDLTGATAESDTNLHIQISGAQYTFGNQQTLSLAGILGVTGVSLSPTILMLSVSAGTTLGGAITLFATTGSSTVQLSSNTMDFATTSSRSFDVSWSTNGSGLPQANLISGLVTITDFGPE